MTGWIRPRLFLVAGLASLFALAFWFRTSSLGAYPGHNGDEAFHGLQTVRLLHGEAIEYWTVSKNVLNPYLLALQCPLLLVARPELWVLRAPSAFLGVLVVALTYVLGRRVLDRTTALIASV